MATPRAHLPPAISASTIQNLLSSLSLPPATAVERLRVTAEFHSIYLVHFAALDAATFQPIKPNESDGTVTLVLRVSGNHIRRTKTLNEVATLKWIKGNCPFIPVPAVIRFDASEDNVLGKEFTLLERVAGQSVDKIYADLNESTKIKLVSQLTDIIIELNSHIWSHIGGLALSESGDVVPGPVLEDTFWLIPDIEQLWGPGESVDSLNPAEKYPSHEEYIRGYLRVFSHAIKTHPSLEWLLQDFQPRLSALSDRLSDIKSIADTKLILAHKDLHFANIMADSDGIITGILDWEFAGIVPALRWDPVRAFLWNGGKDESAGVEKERMRQIFDNELTKRGIESWWEDNSDEVVQIWNVVRFVRAIIEVCPRGQQKDKVKSWRDAAEVSMTKLGV